MRLGGMETIKVDVRIIAATNVDLRQMMEEGRFREDLFYRLHVISIHLPPLRDRKDDIPLLAQHFLGKYGDENRKTGMELAPDVLDLLTDYDWPGNVRELENVIERAVVLSRGDTLTESDLPEAITRSSGAAPRELEFPVGTPLAEIELRVIKETLKHTKGDKAVAAQLLGISTRTIYRKLDGDPVESADALERPGGAVGPDETR